jgi:hypothetical protein
MRTYILRVYAKSSHRRKSRYATEAKLYLVFQEESGREGGIDNQADEE